jgi:3-keto-5-aminohexanoate cleavage enzyme
MIATDQPAVLTCALIGGFPSGNPNHPRTLDDIVRQGVDAVRAGAAVLHIHARTADGVGSQEASVYREIGARIRAEVDDVILNYTTAGVPGMSEDERLRSLDAGPELASLDAGSMNFGPEILFVNSQAFIDRMALEMGKRGIMPELECFDAGMVDTGRRLVERELVATPPLFQIVLGVEGGAPARVDTLVHLVSLLPRGANWAAFAIGAHHFTTMGAVLAMGGHIRTGLEDVTRISRGVWAASNAQLVERAVQMCQDVGRPVATPDQARELLALPAHAVE